MKRESSAGANVVAVFGSTGTAGTGIVEAGLEHDGVAEVRAFTRRALGWSHPKLREVICTDFADVGGIAEAMNGVDACFFCLGTSVRNVTGEAQYREIHVTYALAAARALIAQSPDATFVYLSGAGTRRGSRMMWARVKSEGEDALAALELVRQVNARPAAILPVKPTGAARWVLRPLLKLIPALGIRALDLGRAMLRIGLDKTWEGRRTLENRDLKALLRATP